MISNTELLQSLLESGDIKLQRSDFLSSTPEPLPEDFDFDRVEGMPLGRTRQDDDEHVFELVDQARKVFWKE